MSCPFCMTAIPEGATVCRGCGAYEQLVASGWIGVLMLLLDLAIFIGSMLMVDNPLVGVIGFVVCILLITLGPRPFRGKLWLHNR